ncbi:hypothetical protein C2G38_1231332 [Gigaspora rosea]|uniref:Uncharacterized protein n=1 Tax=Gigaspora rosea TaxID=44941 RepID=A0A397VDM3_9GLOM|nr:hypothetical protein C2G38_1231332 [Gigaspora rosea]
MISIIKSYEFEIDYTNLKTDTNLKTYANAFRDSKFQIIIKNKNLTFGDKKECFFKELLDDYISDKYFIINYGSILMDTILFLKEVWVYEEQKSIFFFFFNLMWRIKKLLSYNEQKLIFLTIFLINLVNKKLLSYNEQKSIFFDFFFNLI